MTAPAQELVGYLVDIVEQVGITYRQADHWVRRGFIRTTPPNPGSGRPRRIAESEIAALTTMARLVHAGLTPEIAARLAREGNGRGRYELADGVHIVLTAPVQKGP